MNYLSEQRIRMFGHDGGGPQVLRSWVKQNEGKTTYLDIKNGNVNDKENISFSINLTLIEIQDTEVVWNYGNDSIFLAFMNAKLKREYNGSPATGGTMKTTPFRTGVEMVEVILSYNQISEILRFNKSDKHTNHYKSMYFKECLEDAKIV